MKIAVITGASSGLGREFTRQTARFYQSLDEIWVIARRRERLVQLSEDCPATLRVFQGDITKKSGLHTFYEELQKEKPDIRMLVNAAGFGKTGTVEELACQDRKIQTDMIDLNCTALTRMTLMCLPFMSKGARIFQVASSAAFCPQPSFAVYAATKAYVLSFSRALGRELKDRKIYVTAVCPGPVDTEFFEVSGPMMGNIKDRLLTDAPSVVARALRDGRHKKEVSVYGIPMRAARLGAKMVPHRLILRSGLFYHPGGRHTS